MSNRDAILAGLLPQSYLERVERATKLYQAHADAVHNAVASLPDLVRLRDGRELRTHRRLPVNVAYRCIDGMAVIASFDATEHGILRHVSISYAKRDPRYRDLKAVRDAFFPVNVDAVMILPRDGEHVNIHEHCLHLFEAPSEWRGGLNV